MDQQALVKLEVGVALERRSRGDARVDHDLGAVARQRHRRFLGKTRDRIERQREVGRSEEHTSELQSLMRISYAVFCLKKKTQTTNGYTIKNTTDTRQANYNKKASTDGW